MRATIGWLGGWVILAISTIALPALAGGGGGGGGVVSVSVPALTPMALAVAQAIVIVGYLIHRRRRK